MAANTITKNAAKKYYQPARIGAEQRGQARATVEADLAESEESVATQTATGFQRVVLASYLLATLLPVTFYLGPANFTGSRLFLTLLILPAIIGTFARARPLAVDFLILAYAIWAAVCFVANDGLFVSIQPAGSYFVEIAGGYFLARWILGTPQAYVFWAKCLFAAVIILSPFALYECLTGRPIVLDTLRSFLPVYPDIKTDIRLGLFRTRVVFEHPILFGVFCAATFSPTVLVALRRSSGFVKFLGGGLVSAVTFTSLASGAYLNLIWQLAIMIWNRIFKSNPWRWRLLGLLCLLCYAIIDGLSNRTPFEVFITYFTFDLNSAYTRVLTWKFGTAEVWRNPIFGIALHDFERPGWLTPSVDNFWLICAMRFGLPGIAFLLTAVFITGRGILRRVDSRNPLWSAISTSQFCALVGACVSLVTVDIWGGSHALFFFTLGSIVSLTQTYRISAGAAVEATETQS